MSKNPIIKFLLATTVVTLCIVQGQLYAISNTSPYKTKISIKLTQHTKAKIA